MDDIKKEEMLIDKEPRCSECGSDKLEKVFLIIIN